MAAQKDSRKKQNEAPGLATGQRPVQPGETASGDGQALADGHKRQAAHCRLEAQAQGRVAGRSRVKQPAAKSLRSVMRRREARAGALIQIAGQSSMAARERPSPPSTGSCRFFL